MKNKIVKTLFISVAVFTAYSFINVNQKNNELIESKMKLNQKNNLYNAGDEWTLVWADEFNNNTLDTNNWNLQIVEAGRFNE